MLLKKPKDNELVKKVKAIQTTDIGIQSKKMTITGKLMKFKM